MKKFLCTWLVLMVGIAVFVGGIIVFAKAMSWLTSVAPWVSNFLWLAGVSFVLTLWLWIFEDL